MMRIINKLVIISLISMLLINCKGKKTKLAGTDAVTMEDFIEFFPQTNLPFQVTDSMLNKRETDSSSSIEFPVFIQFVSDTVLSKQFGKSRPLMYPLGKAVVKNAETYLFVKAVAPGKKVAYIVAFDKDKKFVASIPLLSVGKNALPFQRGGIDKKYTVTQTLEQKDDGMVNESRNVYILNAEAHEFSKIMTDIGAIDQVQEIINPIDTFPHTGKFSGDYIKDKRNYISVRDGKNSSVVQFFVHFEKNEGACMGELKGEAVISGPKTAVYRANGNPCVLELAFAGNRVTMKEVEACGSYRDIKCFFEGSFARKAEKPALKKIKKA